MNSSCGEFGLRIALCDLIERLKRCEQKCTYLERCRHELIKEVMRLRLQNECLSNTCPVNDVMTQSNQLAISSGLNNSNTNNSYNNLIIRSVNELKVENKSVDKTIDYDLVGNESDNRDESWQQITVRLLEDLRRDVANGQAVDGQQRYGSQLNTMTTNEDIIETIECNERETNITNNDTIITINDSLTQLNNNLIDSKPYLANNKQKQIKTRNGNQNETNLCTFNDLTNKSSYLLGLSDNKMFNRNERLTEEQNLEPKRSANYSTLFENNPIDNNIECITAFCSAMSCVKKDLNEVFQALTTQNEKLNKLKAKQLRNYFKRQINFDHNLYQSSTPLKIEQNSNQENY